MKIAERIVMILLFFAIIGGGAWLYFAVQYEQEGVRQSARLGEYNKPLVEVEQEQEEASTDNWREIYPITIPMRIGSTTVLASVADSLAERIMGLSDTPYLPDGVVKLFVFGSESKHTIWMKDMNYPIDIIWVGESGKIVHLEENASPDSYVPGNPSASKHFEPLALALYVIETNAGFVASNTIAIGDKVVLPRR